jgi:antitoxin VapB
MAVAKVFKSGNSQAVRLPKEFRFVADEVEITRQGRGLYLEPIEKPYGQQLAEILEQLSDGFLEPPPDLPPQVREGL